MDLEQLKLILETIEQAGGGAKTLALVYFAKELVVSALGFGVVAYAIKTIVGAIQAGFLSIEIGRIFGYVTPFNQSERTTMIQKAVAATRP